MFISPFLVCAAYAVGNVSAGLRLRNVSLCAQKSADGNEIVICEQRIDGESRLCALRDLIAGAAQANVTRVSGAHTLIDGEGADLPEFIRVNDKTEKITFAGFVFTNFKGEIMGSENANIDIVNCTFINNFVERNSFLNFDNCTLKMENVMFESTQIQNAFILSCRGVRLYLKNCSFSNSFSFSNNSFISFNSSIVEFTKTLFWNNRSPFSSLITNDIKSCVYFENVSFISNYLLNIINTTNDSITNFSNCLFKDNFGILLSSFSSHKVLFNNTVFHSNFAPKLPLLILQKAEMNNCVMNENSGSPIIEMKNGWLKINYCKVNRNKAQSYLLKINNSDVNINNTSIINESSTISLFKIKFSNTLMDNLNFHEIWQTSVFAFGSTISITNSNFINKIALNQAIIKTKKTNITIKNTYFQTQTIDPLINSNQGNIQLSQLSFSTTKALSLFPKYLVHSCINCTFIEPSSNNFKLIYFEVVLIFIIIFLLFRNKIFALFAFQRKRGID